MDLSRSIRVSLTLALVIATVPTFAAPAVAVSPNVVISEVYGGGGNSGATLTHDFIELYNRGTEPVDLTGWSVQYASAAGTTWQVTVLSGSIAPGRNYLIQESQGAGGTTPLPAPDATGTIFMSATAAKVAVVNTSTPLSGSCPIAGTVDLVGYGSTATCFETAATPGLTNTTSASRINGGATDTDNNAADFTVGAPNPQNSGVINLSINDISANEGDAGTTVFSFTVSLGAPAGPGGVTFDIATQDDTATTSDNDYVSQSLTGQSISEGNSTYIFDVVVNGDATTEPDETFFVNVTSVVGATVVDGQGVGTIQADDLPTVAIHDIQAAAHRSPLEDTTVTTSGIVTAKRSNGFYIQDPAPDANDATSEGIFIFTQVSPTSVNVGDSVAVSGDVAEFRPGTGTLTITELTSPAIIVNSSGNPLPAATTIGTGGRIPPMTVIDDDSAGDVEMGTTFDPANDGIDFYESVEGMLVQVNDAVAVGPTNAFGEIPVVGDNGANASVRTARGGIIIRPADFNPERMFFDDVLTPTPAVDVGDTFPGSVLAIVDYSFGNFKLLVTSTPVAVSGALSRETTEAAGAGELSIASFNVENLDPGDDPAKFNELASLIVNNLASPDIIALEEIQDNNGATNDGTVDATDTLDALVAAIGAAGGPSYDFRQINPVNNQDGGEPGGNIRVGFLFRSDRGLAFVDRPGGGPSVATTVIDNGGTPELSASPGRIEPTDAAFTNSRKPLAGEFTFNGATIFVVANHFNSKGGDQPLFGQFQPPTLFSEAQRIAQAQVVNDFVDSILAVDADANVVVLGDLNDFQFSEPIETLKGDVLNVLIDELPENERYTYVFEGNSQALDHILISDSLFDVGFSYDIVHVNSEFADQASDHEPQVVRLTLGPVNAAPTATVVNGQCLTPNTASGVINLLLEDADGDPLTFTFTSNSNATLIPTGKVVIGGSGNVRTVTVTGAPRRSGTAVLTFDLSDGEAATSVVVTVKVGTNEDDILTGTGGVDLAFGLGGDDVIDGLGGNDVLCGSLGDDLVTGGEGDDILDGQNGNDVLLGEGGNDIMRGDRGNDSLTGGSGADSFSGGPGSDNNTDINVGEGDTTDGT